MLRSLVSAVTASAFFLQTTGLAYAATQQDAPPPQGAAQPVPLPVAPPAPPAPAAPSPANTPNAPGAWFQPPTGAPPSYLPPPPPPAALPPSVAAPSVVARVPGAAGLDTLYLKDGGLVRGTMIEMVPNDHVTVLLPTGQAQVVEWGRIDHIERATLAPPPVVQVVPGQPRAGRRPARGAGPTALVHVDAHSDVVLQTAAPGSFRWTTLCRAPCDAELPVTIEYRLAGEGIRPSRPFRLAAAPGEEVVIHVSAATRSGYSAGLALTSAGSIAIAVGLIVLYFGAVNCTETDLAGDCINGQSSPGVEAAGGVIALAGVGILIGGIIVWASNMRTEQSQSIAELVRVPVARPETSWLRMPEWHESPREASALSKPMSVPLFSRSF
jgi:hypothetical protein